MKLALHRSITFWSGLLVMAFICWLWRDSRHDRHLAWNPAWLIKHEAGFLLICRTKQMEDLDLGPPDRIETSRNPIGSYGMVWLPPPFFQRGENNTRGEDSSNHPDEAGTWYGFERWIVQSCAPSDWAILIPHWLVLLAILIPWSALLAWRARRRKRAGAFSA